MTAHLPPEQQRAVRRAYRQQAKHDTAAFLYCFFLGMIGAHRIYLGEWRKALPRLVMGALFLAVLGVGIPLSWPLAVVVGVPAALAVIALGWEILDLFQIDAEVEARNRALLERLIAAPPPMPASTRRVAAPVSARGGIITAEDIAGAQALAHEVGGGRAAGYGDGRTTATGSPAIPAPAQPAVPPAPASAWPPALPLPTRSSASTGSNGGRPSRDASPAVPLAPYAGGFVDGPPLARDLTDRHSGGHHVRPIADVEGGSPIYVDLSQTSTHTTVPGLPPLHDDVTDAHPRMRNAPPIADVEVLGSPPIYVAMLTPSVAPPTQPAIPPVRRDLTDAHPHVRHQHPVADIEPSQGHPIYVDLPPERAAGLAAPPPAEHGDDDALLVLVPQDESPPSVTRPPGTASPSTQPMLPRTSAPNAPGAEPDPPIWPVSPLDAATAPPIWPVSPSATKPTPAAGAAPAADRIERPSTPADAAATVPAGSGTPPAADAEPSPTGPGIPMSQPTMKRVRVVRRIVLEDGGIVRELVAERIVPADADSQAVAAELQAQLGHATPEEIAQLAHLPDGTSVVVRSRVESGPLSGPIKKPDEPPSQGR
jgi:TM2 domain-containing membrane protein YozV